MIQKQKKTRTKEMQIILSDEEIGVIYEALKSRIDLCNKEIDKSKRAERTLYFEKSVDMARLLKMRIEPYVK